jgi:uncharacterized membrane protein
MNARGYWVAALLLTAACTAISGLCFVQLPATIPTHFNLEGEADKHGPAWTIFLVPGVMLLMIGLFVLFPWLSPKEFEVQGGKPTYLQLMVIVVGMFGFINVVMLISAFQARSPSRMLIAGLCVFLGMVANLLGKVDRNFFIGVRTPWTLANERVWIDTHRLAAWLGVLGAAVGFALALVPGAPLWLPFVAIVATFAYPAIHSLVLYKRLQARGELDSAPRT